MFGVCASFRNQNDGAKKRASGQYKRIPLWGSLKVPIRVGTLIKKRLMTHKKPLDEATRI
jgi:hypothetical protein